MYIWMYIILHLLIGYWHSFRIGLYLSWQAGDETFSQQEYFPGPREQDLTLICGTQAISLLLTPSLVTSEPSVPGTGCQIIESHNWLQIPLNSLSWTNPPSHLSLLSRKEQELVWPKDLNVKVNSINLTYNVSYRIQLPFDMFFFYHTTMCQTPGVVSWMTATCWR